MSDNNQTRRSRVLRSAVAVFLFITVNFVVPSIAGYLVSAVMDNLIEIVIEEE